MDVIQGLPQKNLVKRDTTSNLTKITSGPISTLFSLFKKCIESCAKASVNLMFG